MSWRKPGLWLGLASALLVVALVWSDRGRVTPGPLAPVHARVAELERDGCERCHGTGGTTMAQACGECHADVAREIASGSGFHGRVPGDATACAACHVEHHGAESVLVDARSFALAGFPDRSSYDHRGLDFGLAGKHASLGCEECHPHADEEPLAAGAKRFSGLVQACTACHEDVHGGRLPDCAACHGQEHPFAQAAAFAHTSAFPLEGAHGALACRDCHPKGSPFAIEERPSAVRACSDCHASPHSETFLARSEASCERCHPAVDGGFAAPHAALSTAQHAATGFALDPPHDRASCESCHPPSAASFAAAHPGRSGEDCRTCHADPHCGQFDRGVFADSSCLVCHERLAFKPPAFDLALHERTGFALTGSHAAVPCASCHAGTVQGCRQFTGAPTECSSCHADAHRGIFGRSQGCAECHGTATFAETTAGFDHGADAGFALQGAHARVACESCHGRSNDLGRTLGFARKPLEGASCSVCHSDPHGGVFARAHSPRSVEGRDDCARCHSQEAFLPPRTEFDHALWTRFELVGAHAKLSCEQCHAPAATPGAFTPARGMDCASCHADPHAGQFARGGETDCARCHATSGPFSRIEFDHDRDTRFRLDEGHAKLDCSACHRPFPVDGGGSAVRYRPLGTECGDCHDPSGGRAR